MSSRYLGPFRTKPLDVLEQEIDQLQHLYPTAFLQFTDDNFLGDRKYAAGALGLLRQKKCRFVMMVTLDQLCDQALMQEMALAGCLGVAVGLESVDADNCISVAKFQNLGQPFPEAVRHANELGIQVCGLIMLGLPHDTPERLSRTRAYLSRVPCALYDIRILRIYPSTLLYKQMLASGRVTENWWLDEQRGAANLIVPGCLSMHFQHDHFSPIDLQRWALRLSSDLGQMRPGVVANVLRVGRRGHGLKFAGLLLSARRRSAQQARILLARVEGAMAVGGTAPGGCVGVGTEY